MANRNCNITRVLVPAIMIGATSLSANMLMAGEYEQGLAAFNKGQYTQAFQLILASAERGDVRSGFILSTMYRRGIGVEADEYKGFDWCKKAARTWRAMRRSRKTFSSHGHMGWLLRHMEQSPRRDSQECSSYVKKKRKVPRSPTHTCRQAKTAMCFVGR